jgi:hypothetical protein
VSMAKGKLPAKQASVSVVGGVPKKSHKKKPSAELAPKPKPVRSEGNSAASGEPVLKARWHRDFGVLALLGLSLSVRACLRPPSAPASLVWSGSGMESRACSCSRPRRRRR